MCPCSFSVEQRVLQVNTNQHNCWSKRTPWVLQDVFSDCVAVVATDALAGRPTADEIHFSGEWYALAPVRGQAAEQARRKQSRHINVTLQGRWQKVA